MEINNPKVLLASVGLLIVSIVSGGALHAWWRINPQDGFDDSLIVAQGVLLFFPLVGGIAGLVLCRFIQVPRYFMVILMLSIANLLLVSYLFLSGLGMAVSAVGKAEPNQPSLRTLTTFPFSFMKSAFVTSSFFQVSAGGL